MTSTCYPSDLIIIPKSFCFEQSPPSQYTGCIILYASLPHGLAGGIMLAVFMALGASLNELKISK